MIWNTKDYPAPIRFVVNLMFIAGSIVWAIFFLLLFYGIWNSL